MEKKKRLLRVARDVEVKRFSRIARELKQHRGLKLTDLEKRTGYYEAYMSRVFSGRQNLSLSNAIVLPRLAYGLSLEEFYSWRNPLARIIGANIRYLRERLICSPEKLAALIQEKAGGELEVTVEKLEDIENGLIIPGWDLLTLLAEIMGARLYEFFLTPQERDLIGMRRAREVPREARELHDKLDRILERADAETRTAVRRVIDLAFRETKARKAV